MRLFIILQQNVRYARTWAVFLLYLGALYFFILLLLCHTFFHQWF